MKPGKTAYKRCVCVFVSFQRALTPDANTGECVSDIDLQARRYILSDPVCSNEDSDQTVCLKILIRLCAG